MNVIKKTVLFFIMGISITITASAGGLSCQNDKLIYSEMTFVGCGSFNPYIFLKGINLTTTEVSSLGLEGVVEVEIGTYYNQPFPECANRRKWPKTLLMEIPLPQGGKWEVTVNPDDFHPTKYEVELGLKGCKVMKIEQDLSCDPSPMCCIKASIDDCCFCGK